MNAAEMAKAVREAKISAVEIAEGAIGRIRLIDSDVRALLTPLFERALEKAEEIDRKIELKQDPGPLAGVPVIVKERNR